MILGYEVNFHDILYNIYFYRVWGVRQIRLMKSLSFSIEGTLTPECTLMLFLPSLIVSL